jgi:hypothetical protein
MALRENPVVLTQMRHPGSKCVSNIQILVGTPEMKIAKKKNPFWLGGRSSTDF